MNTRAIRLTQCYGGNTIMVSIPIEFCKVMGIKKRDALQLDLVGDKIIINTIKENSIPDYNTATMIEEAALPKHLEVIEPEPEQTIDDMIERIV